MSQLTIGYAKLTLPDADICRIPPEIKGCKTCVAKFLSGFTGNPNTNVSRGPVRYGTGEAILHADDLPGANGYGLPWGQTRSYSPQLTGDNNLGVGMNWQVSQWDHLGLTFDDTTYNLPAPTSRIFRDADETLKFDHATGNYVGQFQTRDRQGFAEHVQTTYDHQELDGSVTSYFGLSGMFHSHTDARGNSVAILDPANDLTENGFQRLALRRLLFRIQPAAPGHERDHPERLADV